jgi:cytochrome P450
VKTGSSHLLFRLGLDKYFARNIAIAGPKLIQYVRKTLTERIESKSERKDFVSFLLKAKESGRGRPYEFPELMAEARSIMIAGKSR